MNLAPEIRRKLAALRWRIRSYVWLQGLSMAAIWLIATFWLELTLDYTPILLGASEMPQAARGVLLIGIATVLAIILYRWIGRRLAVRLADRSMAILLERHFSDLGESLITSVEMAGRENKSSPAARQMMATTQLQALRNVHRLQVAKVLKLRPLLIPMITAILLVTTVGAFYVVNAAALELGIQRIYLLDETLWPRRARIEVVGVEATGLAMGESEDDTHVVPFTNNQVNVARGSDVSLLVRSDATAEVVPQQCTIAYQTSDGDRGRITMTRVGQVRDGFQHYRFDGKPLRGILSDVRFDVTGYDHRIRNQQIKIVDRPLVVDAEIDCEFPSYIVDESTSSWLPRTMPLSTGARLPLGSTVTLRGASNKELRAVRVVDLAAGTKTTVTPLPGHLTFEFSLGTLSENVQLEMTLIDIQNVTAAEPYRVFIEAAEDLAPVLNIQLDGVGDAVTPDVVAALNGKITDDYGSERSWVEVLVNDDNPHQLPIELAGSDVAVPIDFRQLRRDGSDLLLTAGDKLRFSVKSEDRYDLGESPNLGISDAYQLDVVTPEQLLAMLETRELGLRQRFEQIIHEMRELRDSLLRIRSAGSEFAGVTAESIESSEAAEQGSEEEIERSWSLRRLRGQRAILQGQKSGQETLGVAAAFRDIQEQLVNNRVDSEDRRERLEQRVAIPLEEIGAVQFPELDVQLVALVATMDANQQAAKLLKPENPETVEAADAALLQATAILLNMDSVLQNMLELEGYNELLDLVRSLIADQERLIDRTKKEQKRQVLELLQ